MDRATWLRNLICGVVTACALLSRSRPALAVQVRAAEAELAPDVGAVQVDPPAGLEPLVAEHVSGDGQSLGAQRGPVLAVQV